MHKVGTALRQATSIITQPHLSPPPGPMNHQGFRDGPCAGYQRKRGFELRGGGRKRRQASSGRPQEEGRPAWACPGAGEVEPPWPVQLSRALSHQIPHIPGRAPYRTLFMHGLQNSSSIFNLGEIIINLGRININLATLYHEVTHYLLVFNTCRCPLLQETNVFSLFLPPFQPASFHRQLWEALSPTWQHGSTSDSQWPSGCRLLSNVQLWPLFQMPFPTRTLDFFPIWPFPCHFIFVIVIYPVTQTWKPVYLPPLIQFVSKIPLILSLKCLLCPCILSIPVALPLGCKSSLHLLWTPIGLPTLVLSHPYGLLPD